MGNFQWQLTYNWYLKGHVETFSHQFPPPQSRLGVAVEGGHDHRLGPEPGEGTAQQPWGSTGRVRAKNQGEWGDMGYTSPTWTNHMMSLNHPKKVNNWIYIITWFNTRITSRNKAYLELVVKERIPSSRLAQIWKEHVFFQGKWSIYQVIHIFMLIYWRVSEVFCLCLSLCLAKESTLPETWSVAWPLIVSWPILAVYIMYVGCLGCV